jgi:arylamine N-acetyltransferase
MPQFHDAPIFRIADKGLLDRFCQRYGIDPFSPESDRIVSIARAFSSLPYENLTKIIKADAVVGPRSAMRLPDEVIGDHLRWGTGGTCFSLTAALIAVYNALGIGAQPLLADRHYGTNTHCGMALQRGTEAPLLVDPGYLLFVPTPLPTLAAVSVPLGYTTIELLPLDGGNRIDLVTIVRGSRKVRLTYKRAFVDPETFERAWISSFAWEMMTYPVLNRTTAGQHLYLQGDTLAVRSSEKTTRSVLDPSGQIDFIGKAMGISRDIVLKAWEVTRHGKS